VIVCEAENSIFFLDFCLHLTFLWVLQRCHFCTLSNLGFSPQLHVQVVVIVRFPIDSGFWNCSRVTGRLMITFDEPRKRVRYCLTVVRFTVIFSDFLCEINVVREDQAV